MKEINEYTHVYCTRCRWFYIENETPKCKYENECDIWDCEDSKPFKNRPKYEEEA